MLEGEEAEQALAEAGRQSTSRRQMEQHESFQEISPEVGILDEGAFADALRDDPDDTLTLLAELVGATDEKLRELTRSLAGRVVVDVVRTGTPKRNGIGRLRHRRADHGGELDIDRSLETIAAARARGDAPSLEDLTARDWSKPDLALCLLVDRSGSMGGKPLANSAMAAASIAAREPADYSVLVFGKDVIAAKSQDVHRTGDEVVNTVLALRGFGTTDLAGALHASREQLGRSRAARKITVLLSDCRATVDGDTRSAARSLDELVVIAPCDDDAEARVFADAVGARFTTVSGPSDIPDAMRRVLD